MYNEIRTYLKDPSDINKKRMAKAISKNSTSGTISEAAQAWLKAYQADPVLKAQFPTELVEAEKILRSHFR